VSLIAALLLGSAARADEPSLIVRQLAGVSLSVSDSGFGFGAQLGMRLSSFLIRATLDINAATTRRGYFVPTIRGDWLQPLSESVALVAGIGGGELTYGFILDSPTAHVGVLTPEIGVMLGHDRLLGRIFAGIAGFVPLGAVEHPRDSAGQAVTPPHVMLTVLLSL
jgi:hypothetical protein